MSLDTLQQPITNPEQFRLPDERLGAAPEQLENPAIRWDQQRVDDAFTGMTEQLALDAHNLAQSTGEFAVPGQTPVPPEAISYETVQQYEHPEVGAVLDATRAAEAVIEARRLALEALHNHPDVADKTREDFRLAA